MLAAERRVARVAEADARGRLGERRALRALLEEDALLRREHERLAAPVAEERQRGERQAVLPALGVGARHPQLRVRHARLLVPVLLHRVVLDRVDAVRLRLDEREPPLAALRREHLDPRVHLEAVRLRVRGARERVLDLVDARGGVLLLLAQQPPEHRRGRRRRAALLALRRLLGALAVRVNVRLALLRLAAGGGLARRAAGGGDLLRPELRRLALLAPLVRAQPRHLEPHEAVARRLARRLARGRRHPLDVLAASLLDLGAPLASAGALALPAALHAALVRAAAAARAREAAAAAPAAASLRGARVPERRLVPATQRIPRALHAHRRAARAAHAHAAAAGRAATAHPIAHVRAELLPRAARLATHAGAARAALLLPLHLRRARSRLPARLDALAQLVAGLALLVLARAHVLQQHPLHLRRVQLAQLLAHRVARRAAAAAAAGGR